MSPGQRFAIIMFALGIISASLGFAIRRIITKQDARWAKVENLITNDTTDRAERPQWVTRIERTENALVKLAESVSELGRLQAHTDGILESLLGSEGARRLREGE